MVKSIIILKKFIVISCIALLLFSCKQGINLGNRNYGNGNIITQTRAENTNFEKIEVSSGIEVAIEQNDTKSITVEADDNLLQFISTKVENGILIIQSKEGYNSTHTPKVTVKMPVISGLNSSGGSKISSLNTLITTNIKVESSSGSEIDIAVEADVISIESSSGSSIKARGKALKLETVTASGSEIDAEQLMANEVISQSSSGSTTTVSPILILKADAASGSSINYRGSPKTLEEKTSSGGSINKEQTVNISRN